MKKLLSIIFLSFFSMSANADDQQTFVFNNLQGDFTTCYSYYLLSEEGKEPDTTTEPSGINPYDIWSVSRSYILVLLPI